jgi:serine/threonine protein kinase
MIFCEENLLGKGGFGKVYKGRFDKDITLTIKRMNPGEIVGKSSSEFKAEIDTLKRVIHRNIVGLVGYCLEENEKIIIYEYMPKGP